MTKGLILSLLFLSSLLGQESLLKNYTLLANEVTARDNIIEAKNDVLIYSKSVTFRADRAVYNRTNDDLELFGDVDFYMDGKFSSRLKYLKFNLKTKKYSSNNLFLFENDSDLWFKSKKIDSSSDVFKIKSATISSCNRVDPEWEMTFSTGYYNKKDQFVSLYNPTIHIAGVPVFYLPWIGFPTGKERRTGLLKPIFGFENSENIFFVQPFYIANEDNWDLEINPQIRLNRGIGLYSKFRFVDTNHSFGSVGFGIFKDKRDYAQKNNLKNSTHSGFEINYQSRGLLTNYLQTNKSSNDGLLIDFHYLNDVDYLNMHHNGRNAMSKLVTSKANYYLSGDYDYLGLYAKYFIDTEKIDNDSTLQTLPSLQYHRFSGDAKFENILYSFDYKYKNNYRREGLTATQHEFSMPITFHFNFLNDYMNFVASENLYYSMVNYSNHNGSSLIENADYFSNYHKLSLSSDLTKEYIDYIHNIQLNVDFIAPSFERRDGYIADFIPFNLEKKSLKFQLNEYFYRKNGFDFFMHRINQILFLDKMLYKYGDLENQIIYKFSKDFIANNTIFYSHEYNRLRKLQTGLSYKSDSYDLKFNHTYQYYPYQKNANFVTLSLDHQIDDKYDMFGSFDYDFEGSFTKEWQLGLSMKKKCWEYSLRYKESVTPSLTTLGAESFIRRSIRLDFRLSPIGGVTYEYNRNRLLEDETEFKDGIK